MPEKNMSPMDILDGLTALTDEIAELIDGEKSPGAAKEKGQVLNLAADCRRLKSDVIERSRTDAKT